MYALAACCAGLSRSSRRNVAGCGELTISSWRINCGLCAARFQASAPPQSCATSRSIGAPMASISAAMSPTRCLAR